MNTLIVNHTANSIVLTIHRPQQKNSINSELISDLHQAINLAEENQHCRFIVLQGEDGIFCTGMDFQELVQSFDGSLPEDFDFSKPANDYLNLLKRFSSTPKIIISLLDGQVLAGGVGIVAASDVVISTSRTHFGLSEVLWGLLPACVLPYLIRRIGYQKAYYMTLTTLLMQASEAYSLGLIDELTEDVSAKLANLQLRMNRIQEETVTDLKNYFRKLWILNDEMETTAAAELTRLIAKPKVREDIKRFIEQQKFPWESITKV